MTARCRPPRRPRRLPNTSSTPSVRIRGRCDSQPTREQQNRGEHERKKWEEEMGAIVEVKVPDIGDFKDVPVIELHVKAGDQVKPEDPLLTLESDKATMEVPAPAAGVIKEMRVKIGDPVSAGSVIALLAGEGAGTAAPSPAALPSVAAPPAPVSAPGGVAEVRVPDIGDFKDVPVIEIHVQPGATVKPEDSLVTLESDKATMDVPSPLSGTVSALRVAVGDRVSEGSVLLLLATGTAGPVGAGAASAARSVSAPAMAPTGVSMAAASPVDAAWFVLR